MYNGCMVVQWLYVFSHSNQKLRDLTICLYGKMHFSDDCAIASQNEPSGSHIHLPRHGCTLESRQLNCYHEKSHSSQIRSAKV